MTDDIDAKNEVPSLRTLERGLDVLDCFCQGETKLSLTEIAARVRLNPSTASRILSTLEKKHYISRNGETKKYQLGSQILCLISPAAQTFELSSVARPHMRSLFELYNESITLYIALNGQRVCIDRIETTHSLRRVVNIGDRFSLTRGASGKVFLAWMPEEQRKALWNADPLIPYDEFGQIKRQGYAISIGERERGVAAIAAPIFSAGSQIVAALSMAGPTVRLTHGVIEQMIPSVVQTANAISKALGYKGNHSPVPASFR